MDSDIENNRPENALHWRLMLWPALALALCLLLQGRIDGSDAAGYVEGAKNLIRNGSVDASSYYQQRIGMTLPLGIIMLIFGWAPWSAAILGALALAALVLCILRMLWMVPERRLWKALVVTFAIPGLYKWGGLVYPDVLIAALSSWAMVLLTVSKGKGTPRSRGLIAGLLLGWMIAVNPTMLRFGVVVIASAVILWRSEPDNRKSLYQRAAASLVGLLIVLGAVAIAQWSMNGDPLLLYTALLETKPMVAAGSVEAGALGRWLRGGFGPMGEFGLMTVPLLAMFVAVVVMVLKRRLSGHLQIWMIWLLVPIGMTLALILPQMLRGDAGAGEFSTRYLLHGAMPLMLFAVPALEVLLKGKWSRRIGVSLCLATSGVAFLQNASPRLLSTGAGDHLSEYRMLAGSGSLFATPRLAAHLSIEWGARVLPWDGGAMPRTGVYLIDHSELEFLERKYGREVALPTDLPSSRLTLNASTTWEKAQAEWKSFKAWLQGGESSRTIARYRIYHVLDLPDEGSS